MAVLYIRNALSDRLPLNKSKHWTFESQPLHLFGITVQQHSVAQLSSCSNVILVFWFFGGVIVDRSALPGRNQVMGEQSCVISWLGLVISLCQLQVQGRLDLVPGTCAEQWSVAEAGTGVLSQPGLCGTWSSCIADRRWKVKQKQSV